MRIYLILLLPIVLKLESINLCNISQNIYLSNEISIYSGCVFCMLKQFDRKLLKFSRVKKSF